MDFFKSAIKKETDSWLFPSGKGLTLNGINAAGIDTFSDVPINSITREGIQNSLDAKDSTIAGPVLVEFSIQEVPTKMIPGVEGLRNDILPAMKEKWEGSETAQEFLATYGDVLKNDTVPVLQMSDYNTKGLAEKNWQSLIFVAGDSVKDDEASAGSKGIGKFAPFAASNLRMVFYHTVSALEGERSIGVSQLVSFDKAGSHGEVTQGPGYYSAKMTGSQYQPMSESLPFNYRRNATEKGTDLFVVGFKHDPNWQDRIKMSVLSNFLVSIWAGELEVHVDSEIINKDSLPNLFEHFEKLEAQNSGKQDVFRVNDEYKDAFRAFKVLNNSNMVSVSLPEDMVEKYEFIESGDDAQLYLALLDDTNRKVLQTRKSGMKINYKNHISGSINFFGVFQATGQKLNKFLKDIENANHDDWYVDRIVDKKKKREATQFLKELSKFYKESVTQNFANAESESMDVFGLNGILTVHQDSENEENGTSLDKKISELIIKKAKNPRKVAQPKPKAKKDNEIIDVVFGDPDGEEEVDTSPTRGSDRREPKDDNVTSPKTERPTARRGAEIIEANVRLIEMDVENGEYQIAIKSPRARAKMEIEFRITGENGTDEIVNIKSFEIPNAEEFSKSSVMVSNVKKNEVIRGTVHIDLGTRARLGGKTYEIK
ncbi:hypothetical protein D0509_04615 [Weissella cibaria]|uniref:hypothetical protein n=1 Tax=Weissella cibaria TaxID=137591 RepID=UPI0021C08707|nr:hypothetical protein [Weissella cibaria]MCT8399905.1 hypothetical protein [Weissella cibaria]MCT8400981.1 hypothetical protein [Weissella cibaria]